MLVRSNIYIGRKIHTLEKACVTIEAQIRANHVLMTSSSSSSASGPSQQDQHTHRHGLTHQGMYTQHQNDTDEAGFTV